MIVDGVENSLMTCLQAPQGIKEFIVPSVEGQLIAIRFIFVSPWLMALKIATLSAHMVKP